MYGVRSTLSLNNDNGYFCYRTMTDLFCSIEMMSVSLRESSFLFIGRLRISTRIFGVLSSFIQISIQILNSILLTALVYLLVSDYITQRTIILFYREANFNILSQQN
jgi:hypothetical protein